MLDNLVNLAYYVNVVDLHDSKFFRDVGESLLEYAGRSDFSGRGMVTELFPYIFVAAKRLSTRAISDYLRENHHVKLSAASVAKALRESEKHVRGLADKFEPAARTVANAHDATAITILEMRDLSAFEASTREVPRVSSGADEDVEDQLLEYDRAKSVIADEWYSLDPVVRSLILKVIEDDELELDQGQSELKGVDVN
jgi:hypothetical protein